MLTTGKSVQRIVDSDLDPSDSSYGREALPKYFDIIAIDSRGLNNSTPCFSCSPTLASREAWTWDSEGASRRPDRRPDRPESPDPPRAGQPSAFSIKPEQTAI